MLLIFLVRLFHDIPQLDKLLSLECLSNIYFVLGSMTEDFLCNQVILLNNRPLGQKNIDPVTVFDQLFLYALESNSRNEQ